MNFHDAFNDKHLLHLLLLLHADGPMTAEALAEAAERELGAVKHSIQKCRTLYGGHVFRVVGWDSHRGTSGPPWAIYGPGPGPEKRRPQTDPLETYRRYRQRSRTKVVLRDRIRRGGAKAQPFDMLLLPNRQKSFY